ncbi:MAG: hypothetical protein B7Z13_11730 [Caulobacterales bacterium 32-67-6]|nr:MAG: hypothetical protein B7Z13_11730 [Caulobacterales bacterium 32-67-6]
MDDALKALTEREKDALRLLANGHDAKSVASLLGLSVHTVNERLRTARQKLGLSSSRAAARRLAQAEQDRPKLFGDKEFGEAEVADRMRGVSHSQNRPSLFSAWRIGGLLAMLSLIAAVLIYGHSVNSAPHSVGDNGAPPVEATSPTSSQGATEALAWVALLDQGLWDESWRSAGALFKAQLTSDAWVSSVRPVREGVGPVVSRVQKSATRTTTLSGAPAGDYEVIQYQTSFGNAPGAVETVALMREGSTWKVIGYFIR